MTIMVILNSTVHAVFTCRPIHMQGGGVGCKASVAPPPKNISSFNKILNCHSSKYCRGRGEAIIL